VFRNSKPTTSVRREYQGIQYHWLVHQPITSLPPTIQTVPLQNEWHYTHCPTTYKST